MCNVLCRRRPCKNFHLMYCESFDYSAVRAVTGLVRSRSPVSGLFNKIFKLLYSVWSKYWIIQIFWFTRWSRLIFCHNTTDPCPMLKKSYRQFPELSVNFVFFRDWPEKKIFRDFPKKKFKIFFLLYYCYLA